MPTFNNGVIVKLHYRRSPKERLTTMASLETKTFLNPDAQEFFPITLPHHRMMLQPLPPPPPYCFTPTTLFSQSHHLIFKTITPASQLPPEPCNDSEQQQQQLLMKKKKPVFIRANGRRRNFHHRYTAAPAWRIKEKYCYDNSRQVHESFNNAWPNNNKKRPLLLPIREDGEDTTVMIKNIPAKYSRSMLVEYLEKHCTMENSKGDENKKEWIVLAFDFVYLPIDFRSGLNKGYAFVNFTSPMAAWKFSVTASNQRWDLFQSQKRRQVVKARLQGKEKLQRHFEGMNFPCEYEEVLPIFFAPPRPRDGATKSEARTVGKLLGRRR